MGSFRHGDDYGISLKYGSGNFYFALNANNMFSKHSLEKSEFVSNYYSKSYRHYSRGQYIGMEFVYTFGFGLRLKDKNLNISTSSAPESGLVTSQGY